MESTMSEDDVVGVGDYEGAAAGWGALKAVADAVRGQMAIVKETSRSPQHEPAAWLRLPGCTWPDPKHTSSFEFCENGAKAVAWTDHAGILCSAYGQRTLEVLRRLVETADT
jgi:hypothetical protein